MLLTKQASVGNNVWESVRNSVRDSVMDSAGNNVWDSVWESVRDSVWNNVGDSVWNNVGNSVWNSVWESVRHSVMDSVMDSVRDSVRGQHEASWLAFYSFFATECGLKTQTENLQGLWELCKSCGWIMPYKNICFASERHNICRLNENGVIHCENGPAIAYPDGFEIYAWNGTRIPKEWVTNRDTIDPAVILAATNVEQRAAGAACIGWARIAEKLDRKIINGDPESDIGALVEMTLPGLPEPGRFLMAKCPRNGTICEGVPTVSDIDDLPIQTAIAAQAWRDCLPASEYVHPTIRT